MRSTLIALSIVVSAWPMTAQTPDLSAPQDVAAPPADAEKTASGLVSKVIKPGTGPEKPAATDYVTVHYIGWSGDGNMFDSSHTKGSPVMFPLNKSLAGWRECVLLMTVGEVRRCWIPQNLAYRGQPGRPAGTVVFDIELIETRTNPATPPPDVKEPPADAMKTASGLAYRVLRRGIGARRPASFDRVTVHYTGWTTDGKMFDSSVSRGNPTTFRLDSVIAGWTEGVGLMVEGERTRFWIPQELAYKGEAGGPRGMLVFDVELIRIER
jgi:FKBP-type peptidyl-prolyl cis-trans isomerase